MDTVFEKVPPQNIDAEQSLLGAILLEPQSIFEVLDILDPNDFYRDGHRIIYEALIEINEAGQDIDLITVTEELRRRGELDKIGGATYVALLSGFVPTAANIEQYARIICEKSMLRSLISVASRISSMGYKGEDEADRLLADAEHMILELGGRRSQTTFSNIKDILLETLEYLENLHKNKGQLPGVATGFRDLDDICSGLQPSDLIIVAARPS
ncbi:MAG TPA: DnaB-like helicase N-terminal domain-containing protein, partial [Clostridia bacterium]|nr:DnaB-like helicase N-terminal domain-containing protein [Clostridia bacterium]